MVGSKLTKIVATIGPSCDSKDRIRELINSGVNVFRLNMKHNSVQWHEERIRLIDEASKDLETPVGILIDLQGPELRIETKQKGEFEIKQGENIMVRESFLNQGLEIVVDYKGLSKLIRENQVVYVDDGFLEFRVCEVFNDSFSMTAVDSYVIKHRKGLNIPGINLTMEALIDADLLKLDMATRAKVDFVALSFCRSKQDVNMLRSELSKRHLENCGIIAKIENQLALDNLDEIISAADGVMVARGDLGVEVPIEQLSLWQKTIIDKCRSAHKPVIVATQMLQSMIDNPRPTRAEATDVSHAVWEGTDAVMLSGETASGKYPVKAVMAMAKIASFNEKLNRRDELELNSYSPVESVVNAAMKIVGNRRDFKISSIVVFTETGRTAQIISSFSPNLPIIALTEDEAVVAKLTLSLGVTPMKIKFPDGDFKLPLDIFDSLIKNKIITKGEHILVVHGQKWHKPGATSSTALIRA